MQQEHIDNHLGAAVKSARKSMGITQPQLAEKLKITPRYLKAIENSGRKPSYNLLVRIIQELNIPADEVFYAELAEKMMEMTSRGTVGLELDVAKSR